MKLSFSIIIILKLVFLAVLLFASFRAIIYLIPLLVKNTMTVKILKRNIPIIEFVIWLLFSIWSFQQLLIKNQYFAFAFFVVMLSFTIFSVRFFLRDYVAGIIIKSDTSIVLGNNITSSNFSGKIVKFNYRTLELELKNSNLVKIPYSEVLNKSLIKENKSQVIKSYSFEISTKKHIDFKQTVKKIKDTILLLPWTLTTKEPIFKVISEKDNIYNIKLTIFALDNNMYFNIEKYIKAKFSV